MSEEKNKSRIRVGVFLGSPTDRKKGEEAKKVLENFGISYAITYASAHRTPKRLRKKVGEFLSRGCRVFLTLAGMSAHLGGVVAAETVLPVVAVPLSSPNLGGLEALLSIVQMPKGIPVATVAIDGAANGALLAVQILATSSESLTSILVAYREQMAEDLEKKAEELAAEPDWPD